MSTLASLCTVLDKTGLTLTIGEHGQVRNYFEVVFQAAETGSFTIGDTAGVAAPRTIPLWLFLARDPRCQFKPRTPRYSQQFDMAFG